MLYPCNQQEKQKINQLAGKTKNQPLWQPSLPQASKNNNPLAQYSHCHLMVQATGKTAKTAITIAGNKKHNKNNKPVHYRPTKTTHL